MIAWGITMSLMAFVKLLVARALLGVFEAGLTPGITYYITMWYKRQEQGFRMGLILSSTSLGGAFSGLLAYAIASLTDEDSPLKGWQLIFLIDGLVSIIVAIIAYIYITDYPDEAKWLNQEERSLAVLRLKLDDDDEDYKKAREHSFDKVYVLECIIAAQIYRSVDYPNYVRGHIFASGFLLAVVCLSAIQYGMLGRLNELKEKEKISHKTSDHKSIKEDKKELGDKHYKFKYIL
ncbi:11638_t:CDS:2 [Racocetra fulgida]|uniref:11638_t:CDS:1 n=1 Tax=Racocetra fulgida TaxID=60492 RepID=A0A9N9FLK6_9GLOM|nr:11638_t:CDS:2 [Racocetra fulgida]